MERTQRRKPGYVFVARFLAALVVFYVVVALEPVNTHVIVPFTELVVRAAALILHGIRQPIEVAGTVIHTSGFALDVRNGCNGVEAMLLVAAAMIAFPATVMSRLSGLLAVSAGVQILNLVRVSSLVWLGEHHRKVFDVVHVAVWQSVVILAALAMFVFWSVKFAKRPAEAGR